MVARGAVRAPLELPMSDPLLKPTTSPTPGGYSFLPGIEPYSSGVRADEGFEIVRVTFQEPIPYLAGFGRIRELLSADARPAAALCGIELRSPAPFTRQGFLDFNRGYCAVLEEWGLLVDGRNPVARTNVAPTVAAPPEPSLYAFSYARPADGGASVSFVVAGGGDLRGGPLLTAEVVRPGEDGEEAMLEKARYVVRAMSRRLEGLGVTWSQATAIDVYAASPAPDLLYRAVLDTAGHAALHGLHWYPSLPPIDELAFEMDLRGVHKEYRA